VNARAGWHRRIATRVARHALRILPAQYSAWGDAMLAETESIDEDDAALAWAVGCLVASYRKRIESMSSGIPKVARWILSVEMLICFSPLTLMFVALLSRGTIGFAGPLPFDAWYVSMLFAALIGPLGLCCALFVVVMRRARIARALVYVMFASGAWALLGFLGSMAGPHWGEHWRDFVMLGVLPILGLAHLMAVAAQNRQASVAA
jgi:hypothetical protein